jgi:peptidoglycan/LPS O-acetylase OafA/YrhL
MEKFQNGVAYKTCFSAVMELNSGYFHSLDKWRFFAALSVICAHYITFFSTPDGQIGKYVAIALTLDGSGAFAGVNFFFVLSGFLITYLLLKEKTKHGSISIPRFYLRRVLRIWPLYMLSVAIGFLLVPLILGPEYREIANWKWYVCFLANFDQIYHWNSGFANPLLGVHWSIAVEEQFYLLWPWALMIPLRSFPWFAGFIAIAAILFQYVTDQPTHTVSSFHDLSIGGLMAYFCFTQKPTIQKFLTSLNGLKSKLVYLIGFVVVISRYQLTRLFPVYDDFFRTVNALFFAFIIAEQCFDPEPLLKSLTRSFLSYLGKISYGLYLLHPLAMLLTKIYLPESMQHFSVQFPVALCFSFLLGILSYHLFEIHFLKLKARL